jgi:hypothetical protein
MACTVRDAALMTRSARLRLAVQTKPYWRVIEQGLHLGYRRRVTGGTWIARRRDERGVYHESKVGLALAPRPPLAAMPAAAAAWKKFRRSQCIATGPS